MFIIHILLHIFTRAKTSNDFSYSRITNFTILFSTTILYVIVGKSVKES